MIFDAHNAIPATTDETPGIPMKGLAARDQFVQRNSETPKFCVSRLLSIAERVEGSGLLSPAHIVRFAKSYNQVFIAPDGQ